MFSGHDNHLCMHAHTHVHIHMYIHIMSAYACLRNANPFQKKTNKTLCMCVFAPFWSLTAGNGHHLGSLTRGSWQSSL